MTGGATVVRQVLGTNTDRKLLRLLAHSTAVPFMNQSRTSITTRPVVEADEAYDSTDPGADSGRRCAVSVPQRNALRAGW